MCGLNLAMKFSRNFHKYKALNRLINFFSQFIIAPPNKMGRLQTSRIYKKEKNNICEEWLLAGVLQKVPLKFHKIHRYIPLVGSFSNTVKCFHAVRLTTLLNRDTRIGASEPAIRRSTIKFLNNSVHRKTPLLQSLFK